MYRAWTPCAITRAGGSRYGPSIPALPVVPARGRLVGVSLIRTDHRIANFLVWTALAIYSTVWVVGLRTGLDGELLLAAGTSAVYVGMHIFEIKQRKHCYLSADSTAVPASLLLYSAGLLYLWMARQHPFPEQSLIGTWGTYFVVLMAGHAAALTYSLVTQLGLNYVFRRRITAEMKEIRRANSAQTHADHRQSPSPSHPACRLDEPIADSPMDNP